MQVGFKKYPWEDILLLMTSSTVHTISSLFLNDALGPEERFPKQGHGFWFVCLFRFGVFCLLKKNVLEVLLQDKFSFKAGVV